MADIRVYNAASLGGAIRHFREVNGMTQRQLAEKAGVSRDAVIKLESGKVTEQMMHMLSILRAVDARLLVTGADW